MTTPMMGDVHNEYNSIIIVIIDKVVVFCVCLLRAVPSVSYIDGRLWVIRIVSYWVAIPLVSTNGIVRSP